MRPTGVVRSAKGLVAGDHVCWSFAAEPELRVLARDLLAHAAEHGDRFAYVGTSRTSELIANLERWRADGPEVSAVAVEVVSLAELSDDERADPPRVIASTVEDAVRAGFRGVTALSTCTTLLVDGSVDRVRWEHLLDRYIAAAPLAYVCAYDRSVLDDTAMTELAAVHPLTSHRAPIHVFATHGASLGLRGELDAGSVPLLEDVLERLPQPVVDDRVVIDATEVGFVDVHSLRALDAYAQRHGLSEIELRNAPMSAVRILELIPMSHVRAGDRA